MGSHGLNLLGGFLQSRSDSDLRYPKSPSEGPQLFLWQRCTQYRPARSARPAIEGYVMFTVPKKILSDCVWSDFLQRGWTQCRTRHITLETKIMSEFTYHISGMDVPCSFTGISLLNSDLDEHNVSNQISNCSGKEFIRSTVVPLRSNKTISCLWGRSQPSS